MEGGSARVEKQMVADTGSRVGRVGVHVDLSGEREDEARARLEQTANACPVKQSIHAQVGTELVFEWGAT